jgi:hypothetical protein
MTCHMHSFQTCICSKDAVATALKDKVTREQDVLKLGLEECYNMHCFSGSMRPVYCFKQ